MATAAQILNLANGSGNNEYNLGVGFDSGHTDITPSALYGGWSDSYYFFPKPDNSAVVFRMKVTGGRTSSNTKYPRCELREMDVSNTGGNDPKAAWNGASGTHWMRGKTKIVHTTTMKPWICFAQIHNGGSDVIRLQTEGTSPSALKLVARHTPPGGSEVVTTIQSSYTVGQVIDWKLECINGTIKVYLGGVVKYTGNGSYSGCYFKAGLYLQSSVNDVNNTEGGDTSQYAEIELQDFMTWHTGQPTPAATYYEVNGGGTGGGGSTIPTSVNAGADATILTGNTFTRTATEVGTEPITSRKWTIQSAPTAPGGGIDNTQAAQRYGWGNPLVVSDEFNYSGVVDPSKWNTYDGPGHAGNGTRDSARITVDGSKCIITGQAGGSTGGMEHIFDQQYGKWEVRSRSYPTAASNGNDYHPVKIIWPESGQWPEDGEYDFSENSKPGDNKYQAYIHFPHDADVSVQQRQFTAIGKDLTLWHNFAIEWTANYIRGFFDGDQIFETSGGANEDRRDIQTMPSGHLTIQLDNFDGTDQTPAKFEIDWVRIYADTPTGSGSGGTTRTAGPGGVPKPVGAETGLGSAGSQLNISSGGSSGSPRVIDGESRTVGRINITADWVVVQNYKIDAGSQYGCLIDADNVVFQNCDIKGITPTGDGDLNAITAFGNNIDILYNTAINFVSGDPGDSHTDFIQTWVSSSHPTASSNWRIVGNVATGPSNSSRSNSIASIHQCIMAEGYGRGGNSGGDGSDPHDWFIAENEFGDSWNQCIKLDGVDNVNIARNRFVGSSDKIFDITTASSNVKVYSDNSFGTGYGSVGATITSGNGPATPADIASSGGATPDPDPDPGMVGTTIGTAAALSWTPPSLGAYTLRYAVTTAQGTFYDDVVVSVVTDTSGGTTETTYFGNQTDSGTDSASSTVKAAVSPFAAESDGTLTAGHIRAWMSGGSTATKLCVYADNAGLPGSLLAESDLKTLSNTSESVQDYVFSGANQINIVNGTTYHAGLAWNEPGADFLHISRGTTAGGRQEVSGFTWPTLPDPFAAPTALSGPMDVWLEVETVDTSSPGSGVPGTPPDFVNIAGKSGTSASITLESSGAVAGQMDVIIILSAGGETMTSVPAGWQLMDSIQGSGPTGARGGPYTGWVYYNTQGAGSTGFTKSGTRFWHAVRGVWKGQNSLGVHQVRAEASGSGGTSHSTPPVNVINPNSRVVGICMQDLQNTDPGPYEPPAGWNERYDVTKSSVDEREAIAVADIVASAAGQVTAAFAGSASDEAIIFAFVLEAPPPTGGGTGTETGTKVEAAQAILDRLQDPLDTGDFFEDWSYTGMPTVVGEWNDQLLSDYEAATGTYEFPDDIDSGQVQNWLQQFINANTPGGGGGGSVGAPTISAGADATVGVGETFFRVATAEDNGAAITRQSWTIVSGPANEGATMSGTATVTWQFTEPGTYVIAYQATNSLGTAVDTAVITVTESGGSGGHWPRTSGWFVLQS